MSSEDAVVHRRHDIGRKARAQRRPNTGSQCHTRQITSACRSRARLQARHREPRADILPRTGSSAPNGTAFSNLSSEPPRPAA